MGIQKTTVDYLRFRTQAEPPEVLEALRPMFGTLGSGLSFKSLGSGSMGFQRALQIRFGDLPLMRLDFGGESQRGWVRADMSGKACEWVQDWDAIAAVEQLHDAQIRRLDIALTTWDGQVTHDHVLQAHLAGRFKTGGRPPDLRTITSSNERAGRTCYVGIREKSDKFFRAYEKGYEMASKIRGVEVTHIDGKAIENIYRCELELKAATRPISWDVVERRDQYFAGSYPFCSDVLPGVEADILMRRKERAPQMDLIAALRNCRIQFGNTLHTALHAYHGDISAVWDLIEGDEHCQSLLDAGVLLVEHD